MKQSRFTVTAPQRLDLFLAQASGESRAFVQEQIKAGRVQVNGKETKKPSTTLRMNDEVSASFEEKASYNLTPIERELSILYEDEDLLILDKPQGVVVHPAAGNYDETLVHYLMHHLKDSSLDMQSLRPGIVHRLDRGTSGVLVVAKNRKCQEKLVAKFKAREIKKEYQAIVWGKLRRKEGLFESGIGRDPKNRKKMSSKSTRLKVASTRFKEEEATKHFSLMTLWPLTGRTHQLRVHLSESGNPIVGDKLYGKRSKPKLSPQIEALLEKVEHPFLHARQISFEHPITGENISAEAKPPAIFDELLKVMRECDRD